MTISSRECAALFLEEQYAIGQLFRKMRTVPQFELVDVGIDVNGIDSANESKKTSSKTGGNLKPTRLEKLWRRYTLKMEGFECDILEVFPDRRIFTMGTAWLDSKHTRVKPVPPRLVINDEAGDSKENVVVSACDEPVVVEDASWRDHFGGRSRLLVAFLAVLYLLIRADVNFVPSYSALS